MSEQAWLDDALEGRWADKNGPLSAAQVSGRYLAGREDSGPHRGGFVGDGQERVVETIEGEWPDE